MSDYISRMEEEQYELLQRMSKLATFMGSKDFMNLYEHQKELLSIQYHAMSTYETCLTARIRWAKNK